MNLKYTLFILLFIFVACNNSPKSHPDNPNLYGEELSTKNAISFNDLLVQLDDKESLDQVKIQATVETVCQSKGCWMNLASQDSPGKSIFVKFKDYGFFVPMDIAGKEVVIEGRAYRETTSVDELRHYAEDEGKSQEEIEAIIEPVEELKFMASGVEILQ